MEIEQRSPAPNRHNAMLTKGGAITLATLSTLMILTNPGKATYVDFVSARFVGEIQKAICQGPELPHWAEGIGATTRQVCRGAVTVGGTIWREHVQDFVDMSTQRQNFLFFSLYTSEFPNRTIRVLGIFGNFIPL